VQSVVETQKQVAALAQQVRREVDPAARFVEVGLGAAPCEGRRGELSEEVYSVLGTYQVFLPAQRHRPILEGLRREWEARGWEIKQARNLDGDVRGELVAHDPASDVEYSLESTVPPDALGLSVFSPCYRRESGEPR